MFRDKIQWLLIFTVSFFAAGCSKKLPCRVLGKVTFKSEPVANAQVFFSNPEMGIGTLVDVKPDGTFEAVTAKGPGLPKGTYQLAVRPAVRSKSPAEVRATGPMPPPPLPDPADIPSKYRNPATSGFQAVVGDTGDVVLLLEMTDH